MVHGVWNGCWIEVIGPAQLRVHTFAMQPFSAISPWMDLILNGLILRDRDEVWLKIGMGIRFFRSSSTLKAKGKFRVPEMLKQWNRTVFG